MSTITSNVKKLAGLLLLVPIFLAAQPSQTASAVAVAGQFDKCEQAFPTNWFDQLQSMIAAQAYPPVNTTTSNSPAFMINSPGNAGQYRFIWTTQADAANIKGKPLFQGTGPTTYNLNYRNTNASGGASIAFYAITFNISPEGGLWYSSKKTDTVIANYTTTAWTATCAVAAKELILNETNLVIPMTWPNAGTSKWAGATFAAAPTTPTTGASGDVRITNWNEAPATAGGIDSLSLRKLMHEYAYKAATLVISLAIAYFIIKQFRWRSGL